MKFPKASKDLGPYLVTGRQPDGKFHALREILKSYTLRNNLNPWKGPPLLPFQ